MAWDQHLIAEPEGPTFISYKVVRSRLDRLRFVTQDPKQMFFRKWQDLRGTLLDSEKPPPTGDAFKDMRTSIRAFHS